VTVIFDLLIPKVDRFMLLPCGLVVPICIEISRSFSNIVQSSQSGNGRTNERMDRSRTLQDAYNSGKHGNLREFVNSGKFRENSGNLKFTQGIYQMLLIVI